jgi:hypothetical protein
LYSFPTVIIIIKTRRMRLAGHVARMGPGGLHKYMVLIEKPEGK